MKSRAPLCLVLLAALSCTDPPQQTLSDASGSCTLEPGSQIRTIPVAGQLRRYRLQVGPEVGLEGGAPLVFLWHGFGQTAVGVESLIRPERDWPDAIVVAPEGQPRSFPQFGQTSRVGWQVSSGELRDRDLEFFDAMLAELSGAGCVNPLRVYSTGFSNGGFFTNLLGCVRSDALAAIAPVSAGGPFYEMCEGSIPVLITHGEQDGIVPFDSARTSIEHWKRQNSCGAEGPEQNRCVASSGCDSAVTLCSHDGGHVWPRGTTSSVVSFFKSVDSAK